MLVEHLDALSACQTDNRVDVQSLIGNDARCCCNLARFQLSAHHHEDVTVLALMAHPVLVFVVRDGCKADVHAQFGGFEQQLLHGKARLGIVDADEDA